MAAVEDKIESLAQGGGAGAVQRVLGQLDVIAGSFGAREVQLVRDRLVALLGTVQAVKPVSARSAARLDGEPYDQERLSLISTVVGTLKRTAPTPRPALGGAARWRWEPFFEAYFSNFIEGTEFGVDEARHIAVDGIEYYERPADAHDVSATYRLVSDPQLAREVAGSGVEFLDLLRTRHATAMAARTEKNPGVFKQQPNYAGGYRFVEPDLVPGTLLRGFDLLSELVDPFHRAVAMMLLVTEVHPFDDGNGRLARVVANAELSHGGQVRIVIPTSYRNNYLAGLVGVSNRAGAGESLLSVLGFAQQWTAAVDWTTYEGAHAQLTSANAYADPGVAESSGQRLRLPER